MRRLSIENFYACHDDNKSQTSWQETGPAQNYLQNKQKHKNKYDQISAKYNLQRM